MISIIDYGMGNIGSLQNMIRRVGGESELASTPEAVHRAERLLLPGVGSYDNAVRNLKEKDLWDVIDRRVRVDGVPILCICLGAQLAAKRSAEGSLDGFGWFDASVRRFAFKPLEGLRIPHMGWNEIMMKKRSLLLKDLPEDPCFYFVHSYYIDSEDNRDVSATARYGIEFSAALERDRIFAFQFHPEKSHRYGMKVISNFVEMASC